jgi:hypothetical protein
MNPDGWAAPDTPADASPAAVAGTAAVVGVSATDVEAPPAVPVPLRPMRLLDVLDGAFSVLKLRPRVVLTTTAVLVLPLQVVTAYLSRQQLGEAFDLTDVSVRGAFDQSSTGAGDIVLAYLGTLPLVLVGAFIGRMVAGWYGGADPGPRELLRALVPRIPALVGCWFLVHLLETPAAIACLVPVLFVWPLVLCAAPAIGVEDLGPLQGLRRSWGLGSRRYWECFWVAFMSGLLAQVLVISFGLLPAILGSLLGETWGWVVLAAGNTVAELVAIPFVAAAAALTYVDVRVRTEGLDLELRAMEVLGKG